MSLEANVPELNQNTPVDRQHVAVLTYLSQLALTRPSSADMFTEVTTLLGNLLPVDFVLLREFTPDREHLVLSSQYGMQNAAEPESQLALEPNSLHEFALRSSYPIVVYELNTDVRFQPSGALRASGAISGLIVLVGTAESPHAIIEAFSQQPQDFSQSDVHFFHSIANILALYMESKRQQTSWAATEKNLRQQIWKAQSMAQSARLEQDQHEIKHRLVESRERERLRLAQELHDVPIQDLYGLMYQLEDLKETVKDAQGIETLGEFESTIHRVVNNLRAICGELRPPSLSPFGLEVAIRDHVEKLHGANPDLQIHLDLGRDQQILADSVRLCLFRIYQQAINNVIHHAQATEVRIRFHWDDQVVVLEVEDNGVGFEMPDHWVDLVRQEHFGLVGIAERVESVKGHLEIVSTPDHGTSIQIRVPRR